MKKFLAILTNIAIVAAGIVLFSFYYLLRDFLTSLNLNTIFTAFVCIVTTLEAFIGISIMCTGVHGFVYQITGFSLINYGLKKFGIEETDN